MPRTVELRIHGVGGSTPADLLGVSAEAETVQVAGDDQAGFHARVGDSGVQGYVWGKLTSRPFLQPLWIVLFPFTMVNVAGWMFPPLRPGEERPPFGERISKAVLVLAGLALSVVYLYWTANIVMNFVYDWDRFLGARVGWLKVIWGSVLMLALIALIAVVARVVQKRFESRTDGLPCPAPPASAFKLLLNRVGGHQQLHDCDYWRKSGGSAVLLVTHIGVLVLALAGVTWWAWLRSRTPDAVDANLRIGTFATWAMFVLLMLLILVFLAYLTLGGRAWSRRSFRWMGPPVAATVGATLATGFFYGLTLAIQAGKLKGLHNVDAVAALGSTFGLAAITAVIVATGLFVWILIRAGRERHCAKVCPPGSGSIGVKPNEAESGQERDGATSSMYRKIGFARAFSEAGRHADLLLTIPSIIFLAVASWRLIATLPCADSQTGWWKVVCAPFGSGQLPSWLAWADSLGNLIAITATLTALVFLIRRARQPSERRTIGIFWEVLTFWPRRIHPFAVRPYAERTVPELVDRLVYLVEREYAHVVVSAHSQGAVLAYAALLRLPPKHRARIALVTYGCPLTQLYEMAFPGQVAQMDMLDLRSTLWRSAGSRQWQNFFHRTDYIGKTVFAGTGMSAHDEPIADPAEDTTVALIGNTGPAWPDPHRSAWIGLGRHSEYRQELRVRRWIREVRMMMGETRDIPVP